VGPQAAARAMSEREGQECSSFDAGRSEAGPDRTPADARTSSNASVTSKAVESAATRRKRKRRTGILKHAFTLAFPRSADGEDFRYCLNIEWRDARSGQINRNAAATRGFHRPWSIGSWSSGAERLRSQIHDPRADRRPRAIGRQNKDAPGAKGDAPVHFARVTGPPLERAGASGPFGAFIAFLPPAWLGYGANYEPRPYPPETRLRPPMRSR
jgi:hypothetical protein